MHDKKQNTMVKGGSSTLHFHLVVFVFLGLVLVVIAKQQRRKEWNHDELYPAEARRGNVEEEQGHDADVFFGISIDHRRLKSGKGGKSKRRKKRKGKRGDNTKNKKGKNESSSKDRNRMNMRNGSSKTSGSNSKSKSAARSTNDSSSAHSISSTKDAATISSPPLSARTSSPRSSPTIPKSFSPTSQIISLTPIFAPVMPPIVDVKQLSSPTAHPTTSESDPETASPNATLPSTVSTPAPSSPPESAVSSPSPSMEVLSTPTLRPSAVSTSTTTSTPTTAPISTAVPSPRPVSAGPSRPPALEILSTPTTRPSAVSMVPSTTSPTSTPTSTTLRVSPYSVTYVNASEFATVADVEEAVGRTCSFLDFNIRQRFTNRNGVSFSDFQCFSYSYTSESPVKIYYNVSGTFARFSLNGLYSRGALPTQTQLDEFMVRNIDFANAYRGNFGPSMLLEFEEFDESNPFSTTTSFLYSRETPESPAPPYSPIVNVVSTPFSVIYESTVGPAQNFSDTSDAATYTCSTYLRLMTMKRLASDNGITLPDWQCRFFGNTDMSPIQLEYNITATFREFPSSGSGGVVPNMSLLDQTIKSIVEDSNDSNMDLPEGPNIRLYFAKLDKRNPFSATTGFDYVTST